MATIFTAMEGIIYAVDNGADVISMSFGNFYFNETEYDVMKYIDDKGVVAVAGAGNSDINVKFYPAAYNNVISVAAIDSKDQRAEFSNYGYWIDVAAPGCEIFSTMPTYEVSLNSIGFRMNYDYMDGTSMSCPIVAGLAALLLSYDSTFTPKNIRDFIFFGTDWVDTDEYIGNGRINANKSLLIAAGIIDPPNPPNKPQILSGPTQGDIGIEYNYTTSTTDPDGDDLYYLFDWDDGTDSGWIGPHASGEVVSASHTWTVQNKYYIRVRAKDEYGIMSEWSDPLNISMPKNKPYFNTPFLQFLQNLMQRFPLLAKLLQLPVFEKLMNP